MLVRLLGERLERLEERLEAMCLQSQSWFCYVERFVFLLSLRCYKLLTGWCPWATHVLVIVHYVRP